jgi:hypothetical protein
MKLFKNKNFIYRGFEIVETNCHFNIYHKNDELLRMIPKDNNKSKDLVKTFINEHLRKEN